MKNLWLSYLLFTFLIPTQIFASDSDELWCLSLEVNGKKIARFENGMCLCKARKSGQDAVLQVSKDYSLNQCMDTAAEQQQCLKIGNGHTALKVERCFCPQTGNYLDYSFAETGGHVMDTCPVLTNRIDACIQSQKKHHSLSSFELSRSLDYYLHAPAGFDPTISVKMMEDCYRETAPGRGARTVRIVGQKKGIHGGTIYAFKRKLNTKGWVDTSDTPDVQLDPRSAYYALGPVIGSFFGYHKIDDGTYTIPSVDEFQKGIESLNKKLKERGNAPIESSAYSTFGAQTTEGYLRMFANHSGLPVSSIGADGDETFYFHDITLHLPTLILWPTEVLHYWTAIPKAFEEFENYLKLQQPDLYKQQDSKIELRRIRKAITHQIDGVTAVGILLAEDILHSLRDEVNLGDNVEMGRKDADNSYPFTDNINAIDHSIETLAYIANQSFGFKDYKYYTEIEKQLHRFINAIVTKTVPPNAGDKDQAFFEDLIANRADLYRTARPVGVLKKIDARKAELEAAITQ